MRQEKQLLLDEIESQINTYGSFVIMRYFGLTANALRGLRVDVTKTGGNVEVVPKRLLMKAAKIQGFDLDRKMLDGHIGVAFGGKDPLETAKVVFQFSKASDKALEVVGGRFDGRLYDATQVEALSKLPSRDVMRAELLATLEAPLAETLATVGALLTSVMYCLENKCQETAQKDS
jgi:large subunit ribosomal protein L10